MTCAENRSRRKQRCDDPSGLDGSTVSEHLQRAERNVVEELLDRDG